MNDKGSEKEERKKRRKRKKERITIFLQTNLAKQQREFIFTDKICTTTKLEINLLNCFGQELALTLVLQRFGLCGSSLIQRAYRKDS